MAREPERWAPIRDYPAYEISTRGRIRRADSHYLLHVRGHGVRISVEGVPVRIVVRDEMGRAFSPVPKPAPKPKRMAKSKEKPRTGAPVAAEEWLPVEYLPGYEINRKGELRGRTGRRITPALERQGVPVYRVVIDGQRRGGSANAFLEEAFGTGAANAAGMPQPNMDVVLRARELARWVS